ncbi:protein argonaute 4A-like isoform X1 [Euphorbia lathyris]|uniref:protein argonaute 4A-like isoform X1 n=1 Tax=Euphorbia lathyris TaxID=212925 RepID=UPI003313D15B
MESAEEPDALPPPPSVIPPDLVPVQLTSDHVPEAAKKVLKPNRVPMSRRGNGSRGQRIQLLCNHFKVGVTCDSGFFYQYSVALYYEDGRPVDAKGVGRKLIDKVHETYGSDLSGKDFAYDGEKSLFTVGSLPQNKMEFTVLLDNVTSNRKNDSNGNGSPDDNDTKRMKRAFRSKTFKVELTFATKIPMQAIKAALKGQESENSQEAIRVLDIILRQHAAKQGCLLVRQSFFHNDVKNFVNLEGGVLGCRGFHSSFRVTQGGLSLNMDGSTTTIIQPGPLIDFLLANQRVSTPLQLDWSKAKRAMKNLRIKTENNNQEQRITGVSESICREQIFSMRSRGQENGEVEMVDKTVYEYYVTHLGISLCYSGDFPCINVGKPKRPCYLPIELCSLLPLQRYTKALSVLQRSKLVESSRQKPPEKMRILTDVMKSNNYGTEPLLRSCGISINNQFTKIEGRVLSAPKLKVGNGEDLMPRNGRWSFNHKKFADPVKIEEWAVVNFSARCDVRTLCRDLARFGEMKGILISPPKHVFEESPQFRQAPPPIRVEKMFAQLQQKFPKDSPRFILCLLPERKNNILYGPWKKKTLSEFGIFNQCLGTPNKFSEPYLTNVLLKINAKLGGLNSMLAKEQARSIPLVSKVPTIIFGMDVSHGSPGHSDAPSVAAVVSSRNWPLLSRYRASVRTQSSKVEMIDNLFKETEGEDVGIVRELLLDFYRSSGQTKPAQIIIFRDGVSESQFNQVLNIELDQIIKACEFLDKSWSPKFTLIVAQKNHHTKFFQAGSPENVPPGTVVDNGVCHPQINDFYMCAHAGMIGTSRPTHYHVLLDEIGFSPDDLQELVHSLSYVYQKSLSAPSVVAPIRYAHLAASQISQFMKFEDMSETTSSHGHDDITSAGQVPVPELPVLNKTVKSSMFFC